MIDSSKILGSMVKPGRKRLLVTGASGFLGWNICTEGGKEWQVFGVVHSHPVECEGVTILRSDLSDGADVNELFRIAQPDAVFHLAAASRANLCQTRPDLTRKINVDASVHLARLSAERGIPFVFTSSDLVFDGRKPPYAEEDPVSPLSVYGEQKVLAEEGILFHYPEAAVCRMPLMFGNSGPASASFLRSMVEAMEENRELRLFTDELRTPVSARDAVQGLFLALEKVKGLIHLGGRERISRFDLGLLVAQVLGRENARLTPCLQREFPMAAPRPADVSLDSSRAFSLGFNPGSLRAELKDLFLKSRP